MQIAITQVAKVDQAHAGNGLAQHGIGVRHKCRNFGGLDGNVVLDVQAFLGLCQRNALADVPQLMGLRHALGDHGIQHATVFKSQLQQVLKAGAGVGFGFAVGVF